MRFVYQSQSIKVTNLDGKVQTNKEMRKHGKVLPSSIRAIIYDPSNCGKTNVLISLLESPNGVRFKNVSGDAVASPAMFKNCETLQVSYPEAPKSIFGRCIITKI
ncbi:hypothetical protein ALC62_12667 [Cyphomyrmex costatus]|uniref:Uncharacterized protein n=1 Tax=Cyphomyrmex costatus TaxID=456900 RepID=A0A151IAU1_9HYME|nr:hypothetical protein ALC62_12667 [Cyphomyrmex costatus]